MAIKIKMTKEEASRITKAVNDYKKNSPLRKK